MPRKKGEMYWQSLQVIIGQRVVLADRVLTQLRIYGEQEAFLKVHLVSKTLGDIICKPREGEVHVMYVVCITLGGRT